MIIKIWFIRCMFLISFFSNKHRLLYMCVCVYVWESNGYFIKRNSNWSHKRSSTLLSLFQLCYHHLLLSFICRNRTIFWIFLFVLCMRYVRNLKSVFNAKINTLQTYSIEIRGVKWWESEKKRTTTTTKNGTKKLQPHFANLYMDNFNMESMTCDVCECLLNVFSI